ncbi:MAG: hypothetical protein QE274_09860, partial [Verrucomicrobiaceae bacterium]|nr:hypothetical protein [Verrucomicrobiaceae bacterium]
NADEFSASVSARQLDAKRINAEIVAFIGGGNSWANNPRYRRKRRFVSTFISHRWVACPRDFELTKLL